MPKFALNEHAKLLCDLGMLGDMQTPVVKKGTTVKIIGLPGSIPEDYKPWIFEATGRDPESMYKISVGVCIFRWSLGYRRCFGKASGYLG